MLNYFEKTFTCTNDTRTIIKVKWIPRKVIIIDISSLQMKRSVRKGCKVFSLYIVNDNETGNKIKQEHIPLLKEFEDIFSEEFLGLPPKGDINFSIDMIPGAVPTSKYPYQMNIIDLTELKSK